MTNFERDFQILASPDLHAGIVSAERFEEFAANGKQTTF